MCEHMSDCPAASQLTKVFFGGRGGVNFMMQLTVISQVLHLHLYFKHITSIYSLYFCVLFHLDKNYYFIIVNSRTEIPGTNHYSSPQLVWLMILTATTENLRMCAFIYTLVLY